MNDKAKDTEEVAVAPLRRVAIVTGASRGIGAAIAQRLALEGYSVVLNYASDGSTEAARALCTELSDFVATAAQESLALEVEEAAEPQRFIALQADVSHFDEAKQLINEVKQQFGRIDVLVNNAGITRDGLLARMKEEAFDRVIEVNLKGAFNCLRHAAPLMMKQRYGRIISVSSVVGIAGNAGQVNYAASKAGIIGMTKAAAKELASRGITVNAVAPGFIDTAMTDVLSDAAKETILSRIASGVFGAPEDVANAVAFFAQPESEYITGQVLCIDADVGLRNLDITLGMTDAALMDFSDVMASRCPLARAVAPHPSVSGLFLLTAPLTLPEDFSGEAGFRALLAEARERYDEILIDSPAGLGAGFRLATCAADRAIVVAVSDPSSLRDAQRVVSQLGRIKTAHLVVNRVRPRLLRRQGVTIDDAMDTAGLPLLGLVPEDANVILAASSGQPVAQFTQRGAAQAYGNIARRLLGQTVPLMRIR